MSKYFKLDTGEQTTDTDLARGIWYGPCGYWTDDWSKIDLSTHKIPICPTCGSPGFQIIAKEWFEGAEKFQRDNPRYLEFLNQEKEKCDRKKSFIQRYKDWLLRLRKPEVS